MAQHIRQPQLARGLIVIVGAALVAAVLAKCKPAELPTLTKVAEAADMRPLPSAHHVRLSTLPMRDGVWSIERRIATGEDR